MTLSQVAITHDLGSSVPEGRLSGEGHLLETLSVNKLNKWGANTEVNTVYSYQIVMSSLPLHVLVSKHLQKCLYVYAVRLLNFSGISQIFRKTKLFNLAMEHSNSVEIE